MPNIRIIYDNIIDTATTLTSSPIGIPTVLNLQNEYKGKVCRTTGTTVTYTATFSTPKDVGGIALPATNLSASATIQVQLYSSGGTMLVASSGILDACPGDTLELWNWSQPLNANAFIYGGASKTAVWFPTIYSCDKIVVTLVDTGNTSGFIDCARLIAGRYWEPTYNVSNGLSVVINDLSSTSRNDAGDLVSDRGVIHDQLSFDFSVLLDTDKTELMRILRKVGTSRNILVSIFPDNNSILEQSHLIYGKRTNSSIGTELFGIYSHSMEIEGW